MDHLLPGSAEITMPTCLYDIGFIKSKILEGKELFRNKERRFGLKNSQPPKGGNQLFHQAAKRLLLETKYCVLGNRLLKTGDAQKGNCLLKTGDAQKFLRLTRQLWWLLKTEEHFKLDTLHCIRLKFGIVKETDRIGKVLQFIENYAFTHMLYDFTKDKHTRFLSESELVSFWKAVYKDLNSSLPGQLRDPRGKDAENAPLPKEEDIEKWRDRHASCSSLASLGEASLDNSSGADCKHDGVPENNEPYSRVRRGGHLSDADVQTKMIRRDDSDSASSATRFLKVAEGRDMGEGRICFL